MTSVPEERATAPAGLPVLRGAAIPIVILGAGGIVHDAHLPAYRKGGLPVAAIVDRDPARAKAIAEQFSVPVHASDLSAVALPERVVYDVAVPAKYLISALTTLPDGAAVLMQKPMGETLAEAEAILSLCRAKRLTAAVNFQLRWAPGAMAARRLYQEGALGQLHDLTVEVSTHMPWELWSFLSNAPRLEILYHSIHYVDLVRAWLGNPTSVLARTVRNPRTAPLAATKSTLVLDYGEWLRVHIATNHSQDFNPAYQQSFVQWEGTSNAMRYQMGVNLDYPKGRPDTLTLLRDPTAPTHMRTFEIAGNWFPDAFLGSMLSLQSYVLGEAAVLPTSVEDAIHTMRVVEAAYLSSQRGGVRLDELTS